MNIRKWFITLFNSPGIQVDSRILTRDGMGTVTGGSINVRLDNPVRAKNGALNPGQTYNLEEIADA